MTGFERLEWLLWKRRIQNPYRERPDCDATVGLQLRCASVPWNRGRQRGAYEPDASGTSQPKRDSYLPAGNTRRIP